MGLVPTSLPRAAAVVCALALSACASTDYHFSQLYGTRYNRAPIDTYPVTIVRVDGKDTASTPVLVDPGIRKITILGPRGGGGHLGEEKDISLDIRPCTRYYLVAVRTNRLSSDFEVKVDYEEPVGGCTPPPGAAVG
jgi:hypothetical protein